MKRITPIFIILFCFFLLPQQVTAAAEGSSLQIHASVASDGSCQVSIVATIHKTSSGELLFPIPEDATSISLNGKTVRPKTTDDAKILDISNLYGTGTGDFSFTVNYTLRDIIYKTSYGTLELRLPLLSSCAYRIDSLAFSLNLPGITEAKPAFESGYHQNNIEKDISYDVNGSSITGRTTKALIDHETLMLTLAVTESMFPQPILEIFSSEIDSIGFAVCAVLGLIYWLWKLRCLPPKRKSHANPPEGLNAGQFGTVLGLQSANLSIMAFSWAQLGYIRIHLTKNKVLLQKRMEMGNERSNFEQKCFNRLFTKDDRVDCSSYRYALQCQKVAHTQPPTGHLVDKRCGNQRIYRILATLCGLFAGLGTGLSLGFGGLLQPVLAIVFAALGAYTAYHIQNWAGCLFLLNRQQLILSTLLSILWLGLSALAGRLIVGIFFIGYEFLAGILAYYGGRRTEDGRQAMVQVLGFRRYLKRVDRETLDAISKRNPDYFFDLAPYALALGVGKTFARQFGSKPFRECYYMEYPLKDTITATQWNKIMEDTLEKMDAGNRRVPFQEFLKKVRRLTR